MGKLCWYELKKLVKRPFLLAALGVLLAAALLLSCGLREYYAAENELRALGVEPGSQGSFWEFTALGRRSAELAAPRYAVIGGLSEQEEADFVQAMEEQYGPDVLTGGADTALSPTPEMTAVPGYFPQYSDWDAILTYQDLLGRNQRLEEQLQRVLRAGEDFLAEAEEEGDAYGVRRNQDILALYAQPRGEITGPVQGWDIWLFDQYGMTLVFLWVLLAAAGSVAWERDRGTWTLLHTAAKGKGHTLGAKWAVNAVLAVAVTLLVRGAQLGAVWFQAGLSGAGQPAASLEELALCPYPMTVGQFALLTLCLQGLAAVLLATLFTALSAVSRSSLAARNGRGRLFGAKLAVLLAAGLCGAAASSLLEAGIFLARGFCNDPGAPLYSVAAMDDCGLPLSLAQGYLLSLGIRGAAALLFAAGVFALSQWLRQGAYLIFAGLCLVALPLLWDSVPALFLYGGAACGSRALLWAGRGAVSLWLPLCVMAAYTAGLTALAARRYRRGL